jgi:hypothetical protein
VGGDGRLTLKARTAISEAQGVYCCHKAQIRFDALLVSYHAGNQRCKAS